MGSPTRRRRPRDSRLSRWRGLCAPRFCCHEEQNTGVWLRLRQEQYGQLVLVLRQGQLLRLRRGLGRQGEAVRYQEWMLAGRKRWGEPPWAGSGEERDSAGCLRYWRVRRRGAGEGFEVAAVEVAGATREEEEEGAGQAAVGEDDRLAGPRLAALSRQRPYFLSPFPFQANECELVPDGITPPLVERWGLAEDF